MTCDGCGSDVARKIKIRHVVHPEDKKVETDKQRWLKVETCDVCENLPLGSQVYRDAAGQRIVFTGPVGMNYATGTVINSAKDLSEYCIKNNRAQLGGSDERRKL